MPASEKEAAYLEDYERYAAGRRARATTAQRAPDGTSLPNYRVIMARQKTKSPRTGRPTKLTRRQKTLLDELRTLAERFGLDYEEIARSASPEERTTRLELAHDKLIRSQIITWYTLMDLLLSLELSDHFFDLRNPLRFFRRSKRYQEFQRNVLEDLSLRQKSRLVSTIWRIPKTLVTTVERLNTIRNSIAHSLFPEDRLASKPRYKGQSVLWLEGLELLSEDVQRVFDAIDRRVHAPEKI